MPDSWFGVITQCVEYGAYPTVLLYEKLNPEEKYTKSGGFNLSLLDCEDLLKQAKKQDVHFSNDFSSLYSQDQI